MKLKRYLNAEGAEVAETNPPRRCAPPFSSGDLILRGLDPLWARGLSSEGSAKDDARQGGVCRSVGPTIHEIF